MFKRLLKLKLPNRKSAFLWGARQTGKSTYLKACFPKATWYDLLKSDVHARLEKNPHHLREEILAFTPEQIKHPIIIDEIQKVPTLLNEVHWLIENTNAQFILCGSSARKLKRLGTNLLGGRALRYHFYPLTHAEIPQFDLLRALNNGLIPSHYQSDDVNLLLESYVIDYLNFEIREEGLVRNIPDFSRFLDSVAFSNAEMVNFSNIARDCAVSAKTVENYYQILVDTLLGYFLPPYHKKIKRDIISKMPKFYLFDVGVVNYLAKRPITELRGNITGKAFEHFIFMELIAYNGLYKKRCDITYWRTKTGLEVDFVLGAAEIAIEVKISHAVHKEDLSGLIAFCEEHHPQKAIVVSLDAAPRLLQVSDQMTIHILPWRCFLKMLWKDEILQ
ncbi:MAG: AAA family ATPase [Gammaproteobacteria bacterium RIFCSPHIGHO2_12_FULL_38_11]|nr:MAG: AAA family ATPase [Gammaproteobacteria bacterium RIFCSPHIGHO2_12_FULL_38_11]